MTMPNSVETLMTQGDATTSLLGSETKEGFATVQASGSATPWSVELQASVYDAENTVWEKIGTITDSDTKPKIFTFRTLPNVAYRVENKGANEVRVRLVG